MAQLVCVHIHAKEGLRVYAPWLGIDGLEYGKVYEIPDDMVDACMATGHWEKPKNKPTTKKDGE